MATTTKRKSTKKTARKPSARETKATQAAKRQMWAVVIFAAGVLLGCLTFIPGAKVWLSIHNVLFGLFGWSVYFLAPLVVYISVISAREQPVGSLKAKLWQVALLIIMISGAIQIFGAGLPEETGFAANITALYEGGKALTGGGLSGMLFAWPLIRMFEKTGASIIIVLAIFVFVMLITGSSLVNLYRWIVDPVRKIEQDYAEQAGRKKPLAPIPTIKKKPQAESAFAPSFNIDVPIDDAVLPTFPEDEVAAEEEPIIAEAPAPEQEIASNGEPLPGHPVLAEEKEEDNGELDRLLAHLQTGGDRPVEYIAPEEFIRKAPETEEPKGEVLEFPTREPVYRHPLEDDIDAALGVTEDETEEPTDWDSVIRFADEPEDGTEPAKATTPAEAAPIKEIPLTEELPTQMIYRTPPVSLLKLSKSAPNEDVTEELKANAQRLVDTLRSFGVQTRITDICRGPAVTRYELQPSAGVKISKITGLADDIALNLAAAGIRIEAPIPNKPAVGIEVPNKVISVVSIRDIIDSPEFEKAETAVPIALGKDIAGNVTIADIGKMPHMLIAGATGSGKSVCINSIIMSLLYKSSPDEVKLLMIDPKVVELGGYNGIPHLLIPVVTDPKKAAGALNWAVTEMLKRYKTFAEQGVRDLTGYNKLAEASETLAHMPKIVIIIDELADLMMAASNEVEDAICRLAQMARAAGMHLIIATQRPSVDVITGVIKANIPSRIAFSVSSHIDSRTILDSAGAEKLLGRGDMLFYPVGFAKPVRVQGCLVTDSEVEQVVTYVKERATAVYDQQIVEDIDRHVVAEKGAKGDGGGFDDEDEMLPQAIECILEMGQASTSALQRRLKLGYARAARIIDQLEEKGIVGPFEGSKPRQLLISREKWLEMKLTQQAEPAPERGIE